MPPQIGPGCRGLSREADCLWGQKVEGEESGEWGRGLWVEETGSKERMFPFM